MVNEVVVRDDLDPDLTKLSESDKIRYFDLLIKVRNEASIFPRFRTIVKMLAERSVYLYILQTSPNQIMAGLTDKEYRSVLNSWIKVLKSLVEQCRLEDDNWIARESFIQDIMGIIRDEVPNSVKCEECGNTIIIDALKKVRDRLYKLS